MRDKGEVQLIYEWSHTGKYHRLNSAANQDCITYSVTDSNTVISLADGVSSCAEAEEGARIAAYAITGLLSLKGPVLIEREERQVAKIATEHMLYELNRRAASCGKPLSDYSSTVVSAMHDRKNNKLLCFNIGDSIIIGVIGNKCKILAMPYDSTAGCCVITTNDAESEAFVNVVDTTYLDSVILCSDGAWREMFCAGRIKPNVSEMLISRDYESLKSFLVQKNTNDDCSFIAMDIRGRRMQ